ncbi:elongation factor Ts [Candidatus Methylopumilus universalis]|uniref:Elongation factor Ts n=1 Tax=Candidatus Methylopumilus universalis TaxID=2588536 RepID=A0AAX1EZC9_9PROT|nr:translation elongation factor Ts [Candidatus Methylopumilus universalis]MCF8161801.1 translation elongation factor Ts [Candidatus Methylopumilus sp.]MCF8183192.1 translation elongation factor Ts [Limnohabitans sp.]QDC41117.1 elongation factor Ts [Candidatus Methylopumilus universalis]QDC42407.1 elongation factor Ts [Candidatus Methylopumilus universalis]QDC46098.1 elongation factor Ts [Candidatus Methylopumilus universalis]
MAEITASMVKDLRDRTDAPMMDCKKALTEADGDSVRAEEILRVRFGNKASKAAGRLAAEGIVIAFVAKDGKTGTLLEVNSETDFCAKNEDFLKYTNELVSTINEKNPANIEALTSLNMASGNAEEVRTQLVGKIGENITPRRFVRYQTTGQIFSYIHSGRIGVLLDLQGGDEALGKDLAMHIAANKPKALNASGIDAALIEVEKRVAIEKAKEAGKPEAMLEKIAEGTVQKFLKEVTLLNQPFVKDDKVSVEQLLKANNATVNAFSIYSVAEGIEKAVVDYAAEVAAAAKV